MTPQFLIAIATILGLLIFLAAAYWKLGMLAGKDQTARDAFLKLMNPASIVSLLILLGVLFLLGMAILDLDKGRVLVGMGKAPFARGLITYLFAIVTIGTAVALVLSALLGTEKEKFENGKEVLGLLLGVFGTIVGFYFASELAEKDVSAALSVSSVLVSAQEVAPDSELTLTVAVQGGKPPYRFDVKFDEELASEYLQSRATRNWVPGSHELMARSVLRKNPNGDGFVLVCAPENEAGIYQEAMTLNLWPKSSEFGGPVKLIGADPTAKGTPATAATNQALGTEGGYDYSFVEGGGHLLQIEKPEECYRITTEFLAKHAFP